jgi:hypothetical protein
MSTSSEYWGEEIWWKVLHEVKKDRRQIDFISEQDIRNCFYARNLVMRDETTMSEIIQN